MDTTIFLTITSTSTQPTQLPMPTTYYTANTLNNIQVITTLITSMVPKPSPPSIVTQVSEVFTKIPLIASSASLISSVIPTSSSLSSAVPSNTLAQLNSTSPSGSLKSGLSIGLIVTIVVIFVIAIIVSLLIKMKRLNGSFFSIFKERIPNQNDDLQTAIDPKNYNLNSPTISETPNKRQSVLYYFKDRLSKFGTRNLNDDNDLNQESRNRLSQIVSPILLKKFNLNKPKSKLANEIVMNDLPEIPETTRDSRNKLDLKLPLTLHEVEPNRKSSKLDPMQSIYITIQSYSRRLEDELSIRIGDKVVIQQDYLDGWCLVRLLSNGRDHSTIDTGMVPKACLLQIK